MAQPVDCPYFFGDYHRGLELEKCRLIARNRENRRPWRRALCDSCPVPGILAETTCAHLALEASVERKLGLFDRVTHLRHLHRAHRRAEGSEAVSAVRSGEATNDE